MIFWGIIIESFTFLKEDKIILYFENILNRIIQDDLNWT